MVKQDSNLRFK